LKPPLVRESATSIWKFLENCTGAIKFLIKPAVSEIPAAVLGDATLITGVVHNIVQFVRRKRESSFVAKNQVKFSFKIHAFCLSCVANSALKLCNH